MPTSTDFTPDPLQYHLYSRQSWVRQRNMSPQLHCVWTDTFGSLLTLQWFKFLLPTTKIRLLSSSGQKYRGGILKRHCCSSNFCGTVFLLMESSGCSEQKHKLPESGSGPRVRSSRVSADSTDLTVVLYLPGVKSILYPWNKKAKRMALHHEMCNMHAFKTSSFMPSVLALVEIQRFCRKLMKFAATLNIFQC